MAQHLCDDDAARAPRDVHRRLLEAALEHIRDYAIVLMDADRRIVGWNRGAELLFGYAASEAEGQSADVFFTPEDRAAGVPEQEAHTARCTGRAVDERWHLRRDGSRFVGSGIMTPAHDGESPGVVFVKVVRDVTERQLATDALARSEERYRLLVDSIRDYAIFMLDADGRVTYWTPAAERINGYAPHEILGQPFAVFFTEEAQARGEPDDEIARARRDGRAEGIGWRVRSDGSCFWGDEILTALHDAQGAVIGFSKITRDDTARRQADLERERLLRDAQESNRLKDEFLGTISHELRTPLNAVIGWTQLMRLQSLDRAALAQGLDVIERNARAQLRLVEDLLDMSRFVMGTHRLDRQPATLAEPLAAALQTVRPSAIDRDITLAVHHGATVDTLYADVSRLHQVIWNILSNAIKFTPPGGTVTVTTTTRPPQVELEVADTGIGIDPEFLPLVFDRFRQAHPGTIRGHGGLGLGLSIVRHLVELHDGRVSVESPGRGQGTCVRVLLPLHDADDSPPQEARC